MATKVDPAFRRNVTAAPPDRTVVITVVALLISLVAMIATAFWLAITAAGALIRHLTS